MPKGTQITMRLDQRLSSVGLLDEVLEHRSGDFEVGDDSVTQGANGLNAAGRAPEHLFGLAAYRANLPHAALVSLDGNDGGLTRHDALAANVDECIGSPQIDREIAREQSAHPVEEHPITS